MPQKKILFVCHGNICRSPMAEFVMKFLVEREGASDDFEIASAAVSSEELGNPVYPPVRRLLSEHGIDCRGKYAYKLQKSDYDHYDLLICMDQSNVRNLLRIVGEDKLGKIKLLMDYTDTPKDVADPWYSGNFDATWADVNAGCRGLLKFLTDGDY